MPLVEWIGAWPGAVLLQRSGTIYLFVNAAHIASIGLLIGGILPLDLRLAGLLRGVPLAVVGPFLSRSAAIGMSAYCGSRCSERRAEPSSVEMLIKRWFSIMVRPRGAGSADDTA